MKVIEYIQTVIHGAHSFTSFLFVLFALSSCTIDPPLHLPAEDITLRFPMVRVDVEAVWGNPDWEEEFLYQWDENDIEHYGEMTYPEPIDYQLRRYYLGDEPDMPHTQVLSAFMSSSVYRSQFDYGYHDLLVWSNIHNAEHVQTITLQETLESVDASTNAVNSGGASKFADMLAKARAVRAASPRDVPRVYNQPDIFYSAYHRNLHVTDNPADYDFYDDVLLSYVKRLQMELQPLVYIYAVQVILRNNNGKITGASDGAAISGLADGVNVNYGRTTDADINVQFDLGMKYGLRVTPRFATPLRSGVQLKAAVGETVDVLGGRLTTFGLCGMKGYADSRSQVLYAGTHPDNLNHIAIDFKFRNDADSIITYDITSQLQNQSHGGVITIEVDVNDIPLPYNPDPHPGGGSGFDPYIKDYEDGENHEIEM